MSENDNSGLPFVPPPPDIKNTHIAKYADLVRRDGVRRRNAGGIKPGLPMIITGGSALHKEFHYQFTDPGKFKKKNVFHEDKLSLQVQGQMTVRETIVKARYRLPFNFCPDCNKNDKRLEEVQWIGVWMVADPHEEIDLNPGETIIHCKCAACVEADKVGKVDIEIPTDSPEIDEWRKSQITQNRMERNLVSYIRNRLAANDIRIVVSAEERERMLKGF